MNLDTVSDVQNLNMITRGGQADDSPRDIWNAMARVAVFLEVRDNGDYLPLWSGDLDIMTAAGADVALQLAAERDRA